MSKLLRIPISILMALVQGAEWLCVKASAVCQFVAVRFEELFEALCWVRDGKPPKY
jgi:hypothetical protein